MLGKTKHLNNDFLIKILYEKTCAVQPINVLYFFHFNSYCMNCI